MKLKMSFKIGIVLIFLSCNVFAQDLSFLSQPNIVYGIGESRKSDKADDIAFEDLAKRLCTEVISNVTTTTDNESVDYKSKAISSANVRIIGAKKIVTKVGRKYVVYEYFDFDSPYCKVEYLKPENNTYTQPTKTVQPVKVIVQSAPVAVNVTNRTQNRTTPPRAYRNLR